MTESLAWYFIGLSAIGLIIGIAALLDYIFER